MWDFCTGKTGCDERLKRKPPVNSSSAFKRAKQETLDQDHEYKKFVALKGILQAQYSSEKEHALDDDADPDYKIFLQRLKRDSENFNRGAPDAFNKVREEELEIPEENRTTLYCSLETEEDDGRSDATSTGTEKNSDYSYWWCFEEEDIGSHPSQFRKKLMEILSLPYDEREYQLLWKNISSRKPKQRQRELRGREILYSGASGKSYLDYYPAVKEKLENERNRHRALNLLRGFFFWLKNLMHRGAFLPWLDSSCLNVEP